MIIPLEKRLKKSMHVEIARLQDEVVEILYGIENELIVHGDTAIWRCYGGNRFSEDLDFYCRNIARIERHFREKVEGRGLTILKFKKTKNLIFCKISDRNIQIRVEINYAARVRSVLRPYEKTDGSFLDVLTLSPEDLILEKITAYKQRRFIRDIYDVYHILKYVKNEKKEEKIRPQMSKLLASLQQPIDEKNLKAVVYSGKIPSFSQIAEYLRKGLQ